VPKAPQRLCRMLLLVVLVTTCIGCDQATKTLATDLMQSSPPISLLADTIRIEYAENPGAFLGLGSTLPRSTRTLIFGVANGALLLLMLGTLVLKWRMLRVPFLGLGLMAGGGLSNLIDRVLRDGRVTDFLNLGIGPIRTGIFNVADVAIVVGVGLLLVAALQETKGPMDETARKPA